MNRVVAAYEEVQQRKGEAIRAGWPPDDETAMMVLAAVRDQFPNLRGLDNLAAAAVALHGMAWIARMCGELDLVDGDDVRGLFDAQERILETVMGNLSALSLSDPRQLVGTGIGAGFNTGLWMGRLLAEWER